MKTTAPPLNSSSSVEEAVEHFAGGKPVLVAGLNDSSATVALAAARITTDGLATMHQLGSGMIVVGVDRDVARRLNVAELAGATRHPPGLRLASPVDASDCRQGGSSLEDRVHTIRTTADPAATPADLTVPGHVHAGVIDGAALSAPAAATQLAYATDQAGAVLLAPLTDLGGEAISATVAGCDERLRKLPLARIEELWWAGDAAGGTAESIACRLPTRLGDFAVRAAVTGETGETIVTLIHGNPVAAAQRPARSHAACLLGDTFGSQLCDCRERLELACEQIRAEGAGALLYIKPVTTDPFHCPRAEAVR
jgi:3,4-dihydroxy 2-butanone 4-phosphate synthase/GTP cyclohydrolase II